MKYRIWSNKLREWITQTALVSGEGTCVSLSVETDETTKKVTWRVHNLSHLEPVVEPFSGHADKNGKEIYVGDILDNGFSSPQSKAVVVFHQPTAGFVALSGDGSSGMFNMSFTGQMTSKRVIVIGNIHENPELRP
jgi:uncharacterized phage protein (TIGR01671 family)